MKPETIIQDREAEAPGKTGNNTKSSVSLLLCVERILMLLRQAARRGNDLVQVNG